MKITRTITEEINDRKEGYKQVAVMTATEVAPDEVAALENWFLLELRARTQYLGTITTLPTGKEPGGRRDTLLAIHEEDLNAFCSTPGRKIVRWLEDVIGNADQRDEQLYPVEIRQLAEWSYAGDDVEAFRRGPIIVSEEAPL